MAFRLRTQDQIDAIAATGALVERVLAGAADLAGPGVTGLELDEHVRAALASHVLESSLLGYTDPDRPERSPFRGVLSINLNDIVANAEPDDRPLRDGDVVTLDLAAGHGGWHADAAVPLLVGDAERHPEHAALVASAHAVTAAALHAARPGGLWSEAAEAARREASRRGVTIAPGYGGHGIGRDLHEPPGVRFETGPGDPSDFLLAPGTVFTIEPIVLQRDGSLVEEESGWGVRTRGGSPGACRELTVAVSGTVVRVLCGSGLGACGTS